MNQDAFMGLGGFGSMEAKTTKDENGNEHAEVNVDFMGMKMNMSADVNADGTASMNTGLEAGGQGIGMSAAGGQNGGFMGMGFK